MRSGRAKAAMMRNPNGEATVIDFKDPDFQTDPVFNLDKRIRVIIESPLSASNGRTMAENRLYGLECVRDCVERGEAPIAAHLLLPLVLDDTKPEEREIGMACGFSWYSVADKLVVYTDFGTSSGMQQGIDVGRSQGLRIEYRRLY
ncbi:MAG: hypothetical protein CMQ40_10790 [Gammaproteobacteria bacterium]|nr:hypothetical protein [Gammaproteobacteria bacterium]